MQDRGAWLQLQGLLAQPRALRTPSLWAAGAVGAVGTSLLSLGEDGSDPGIIALLNVAWWLIAVGMIQLAGLWALRSLDEWTAARSVLVCAGAMIVGYALVLVMAAGAGSIDTWLHLALWLPAAILAVIAWLVLVAQRRADRETQEAFSLRIITLQAQADGWQKAGESVLAQAESVAAEVHGALLEASRLVDAGDLQDPALRKLLDREVREPARIASHRIRDFEPNLTAASPARVERLLTTFDLMATSGRWYAVAGYGLVLLASLPYALLTKPWPAGALSEVGADALGLLITSAVAWVVARSAPRLPQALRRAAVPLGLLFGLVVAIALAYPVGEDHLTAGLLALTVLVAAPGWTVIALIPAIVLYGARQRAVLAAERSSRLLLAQEQCDAARDSFERVQGTLVSRLHGQVQGRAIAALAALDLTDESVATADALVETAVTGLMSARILEEVAEMAEPGGSGGLEGIMQVVRIWRHVIDVELQVEGQTPPRTLLDMTEAVNEALANAVRHGGAASAGVEIAHRDSAWVLTVSDDGVGPAQPLHVGIGLGRLPVHQWHLARESDRTVLTVSFPDEPGV